MAVHLAVAGDVVDGVVFLAVLFSHEMSWKRSGTELTVSNNCKKKVGS